MLLTAIDFSFIPPTGKTLPVNETSPVIAVFCFTDFPKANEIKELTIVQPALGPSFGTAPYKEIFHFKYNYIGNNYLTKF